MADLSTSELVRRDQAAYAANYPDGPSPAVLDFIALDRQLAEEDERDFAERGHRPLRRARHRWARPPSVSERTGRTAPGKE